MSLCKSTRYLISHLVIERPHEGLVKMVVLNMCIYFHSPLEIKPRYNKESFLEAQTLKNKRMIGETHQQRFRRWKQVDQ